MRFDELVAVSDGVGAVSGRGDKIEKLAAFLSRLSPDEPDEIEVAVAFLTGAPRQGRIGIGPAALTDLRQAARAELATLELLDVDRALVRIAGTAGAGSTAEKAALLRALVARATPREGDFLVRLLFGELRQGALEGVIVEAVARASRLPADRVRRAVMMAGGLGAVTRAALTEGERGLGRFQVQVFQPLQPMLAETAEDTDEAMRSLGEAALEFKLDGARIQVHKAGDEVRVFSRQLREVTAAVPEVVEAVRGLPARELILDGEVIALRPDRTPHPFQVTMRRFGRKLDVHLLRAELPLFPVFFDCLRLNGGDLLDEPQRRRFQALGDLLPAPLVIPHLFTARSDEAEAFLKRAVDVGHEGLMAKAPDSTYVAGGRGQAWLKIKQARTLDLVVLAAEWGSGRRQGWLSNLHLGARDPERGAFVMLGKTFKGLTDEMLRWQTERLLALETARDSYVVHVRPELVVEIAFNDVQQSPRYPGGLALRFARVKRYRTDKTSAEADTLFAVQEIYRRTAGVGA